MPLTLVQKRALLAAANNVHKKEHAFARAGSIPWSRRSPEENKKYRATARASRGARELLARLEQKLGVNGTTVNYHIMSQNVIANVLKKNPRVSDKIWRRGIEEAKKLALANMKQFNKNFKLRQGRYTAIPTVISSANTRRPNTKSPSPPRRRTPSPARPANNAHRRVHGIGPANNTRVTWSRNANGKINRFNTLEKINMKLTQEQRNALLEMSENQAKNTIRQLARQR